ncbi:hypothetical protein AGDE_16018 [Angomonas deanei]|uniref:Inositol 1,4,5-trisphosphate/ryanodine receptor, putative n=1 Tax=Angomonas deanei TaxID=59799 RepID=A0A7G2CLF3_9TRYP|nr:hypothetical protein AGDE_16018 [Angomonas deanei]CAD2220688.1 Inositol 1,4,5-trisphosphate/ryanodine receptor, putative [Angomonas deanei]|eukprot:EPY17876.1 hypothetical protein AGDE_16018 [Angomonas deanei]
MNDPTDGIGEGTNITYGMVFSLQHMSSQLYLSVAHSQPSENDPDCVSVVLVPASAAATPSCEFTFVSRYKVRGDGDNVCKEDEVLLRLASRPVYLHVSAPRQLDEASTELEEGDVQVINRTFRLGANMSFLNGNMMSNATTLANNNSIGLHNTDSATANLSFFGAAELTAGLEETMKGYEKQMANILPKRDSGPFTALHALTREYLDEVNGCEEGGVTFTVHRYDIGKDRCELQRSQLHISKQHVACGVPLSLFHQERESFLTTSVTNPREVTATVAVKVDDGAVEEDCSGVFKQRSAAAHLSQVTTSSGAEGQLCQKAPAAGAAGGGGLESGTNTPQTLAETVKGFSAAPSMTSASRETGAQARYTAKMKDIGGLVDTGKGEFLPFPVFAEHPKSAAELKQDAMLGDVGTHINSLWSFECEDPTCGGPVRLESESYRVKHVMTGLYLAVCGSAVDDFILEEEELESDGHPATAPGSSSSSSSQEEGDNTNNTGSSGSSSLDSSVSEAIPLSCRAPKNNDIRETCLCLIPEPRTAHDMRRTLFTVETMFQTEMLWLVEQECFTLRNVLTQMYVCTDSAVEGSNVRLSLQWQPVLADTLVVTGVLPATQRCALLLRDQCFALGRYKDLMQETAKMVLAERQQVADAAEAGEETAKLTMRRWREEAEEGKAAGERSRRGPDIDFELYRAKRRYHEAPHTAQPPPPVHGDYRHLTHAIHAAQRALETLIRLCIETREFNIFTAEGIPNAAHQRMLFEIQLHKLLFDVVLAPLALLQTDLHAFGPVVKSTVAPQLGDHLSRGGGRLIDMLVDKQTRPVTSLWEVNRDWCRTTIPSVPLQGGLLTPDQLLQPLHRELHLLTRLAFRLLRCMAMRNSALTQGWTEYLDICLFLDGNRLHVVDALKEMFTDNLQLDLSSVQKVGEHFINISKSVRKGSYINFLGAACTYRFQGIAQRQAFVCKRFLMEHPEMFCTFKVEHGVLHVHPAGHNKNRWYPVLEFFEKNKDPREVKYVEYQISLLARLCYEGCPPFTRNEVKKIFTEEIALVALRTICWTGKEHVGHRSGTDILRSHFLRLAMQVHVLPRASDPWVQLRVTTVLFGSSGLRQKHCDNYSGLQDDEITRAVKHVCLCLLRANTFFIQDDVDRSTLMRSVVSVLLRLIRYRQYKLSEIEEVIPLFLLLLDGTRDIVDSRRLKSQIEATQSAQTPFQPSATNNNYRHTDTSHLPNRLSINLASIHLIRVREMVCLALIAALENATFTAAEEVILYLYECYTDGRPTAYPWRGEGGSEKGGGFSAAMESTCCGGCKKRKRALYAPMGMKS